MATPPGSPLLAALRDPVALLEPPDRLVAANAPMQALLRGPWAGVDRLADLLPPAALAALAAGAPARCARGGRVWELRLVADGDRRVLLAGPPAALGEAADPLAPLLAAARLRALAALAAPVVHDLGNAYGAAVGLAEVLLPKVESAADRQVFGELLAAARHGLPLLRGLVALLAAVPTDAAVRLDAVVGELAAIAGKAAARQGLAVAVDAEVPAVVVRAPHAAVLQALLHVVTFALAGGARRIGLRPASGRPGAVVLVVEGLAPGQAAAVVAAAARWSGDGGGAGGDGGVMVAAWPADLWHAAAAVRRCGGLWRVVVAGEGVVEVECGWPVAR